MDCQAFINPAPLTRLPVNKQLSTTARKRAVVPRLPPRAELSLEPGIPSGIDPQDNCPPEYYKPRPRDSYKDRSFTTVLPRNWEGVETSIGGSDVDSILELRKDTGPNIVVPPEADTAFLNYSAMMAQERRDALEILKSGREDEETQGEQS